jgi:hypothetical protein
VLWLPTITVGGDYYRHDGRNQDTSGNVFDNSRSGTRRSGRTRAGRAEEMQGALPPQLGPACLRKVP